MIVSTADARLAKLVSYWIMMYSPAGALGGSVTGWAPRSFRETSLPSGLRAPSSADSHFSFDRAERKYADAASQLSPYLPASTSASQACADASAAFSAGLCAGSAARARAATAAARNAGARILVEGLIAFTPTARRRTRAT